MAREDRVTIGLGPARLLSPKAVRNLVRNEATDAAQEIERLAVTVPSVTESQIQLATVTSYTGPVGTADLFLGGSVTFTNSTAYTLTAGLDIVVWPTSAGEYVCVGILQPATANASQAPLSAGTSRQIRLHPDQTLPTQYALSNFVTVDTADLFGLGAPAIFARTRSLSDLGIWIPSVPDFYTVTGLPGRVFFYSQGVVVCLDYDPADPANSEWYTYDPVNGLVGPNTWDASLPSAQTIRTLQWLSDPDAAVAWAELTNGVTSKVFRFDATNGWEQFTPSYGNANYTQFSENVGTKSFSSNGWVITQTDPVPSYTGPVPIGGSYYWTNTVYIKDGADSSAFTAYPQTTESVFTNVAGDYVYADFDVKASILYGRSSYAKWDGSGVRSILTDGYTGSPPTRVSRAVLIDWDAASDVNTVTYLDNIGLPMTVLGNNTGDGFFVIGSVVRAANESPYTGKLYLVCAGIPSYIDPSLPNDPVNPGNVIVGVWSWDFVNPAVLEYYDNSITYKVTASVDLNLKVSPPWFDGTNINFTVARNGARAYDFGSTTERDTEYYSSLYFSIPE
jgi:hypothetical protein